MLTKTSGVIKSQDQVHGILIYNIFSKQHGKIASVGEHFYLNQNEDTILYNIYHK